MKTAIDIFTGQKNQKFKKIPASREYTIG